MGGVRRSVCSVKRYLQTSSPRLIPLSNVLKNLKLETACLAKEIELLEVEKRKLLGEGLGSCTLEELQQVEQQLEKGVCAIRDRKLLSNNMGHYQGFSLLKSSPPRLSSTTRCGNESDRWCLMKAEQCTMEERLD